ncbi:MAG TPA: DNA recombination protein RmuC [Terriglobia bacterium]|nr:DNA recombination protein RmuC [Terriglobia bacterium]HVB29096.1 DNA recombination protein RmuC [Terriglobia bacterium]
MNQWILFIVGIAVGGLIGWLLASLRRNSVLAALEIEAEGKTRAAESMAGELRTQVADVQSRLNASEQEARNEANRRVAAETRLTETQSNLEDQKRLLEEARVKLADAFQALAAEALKSNNQAFIALARSTFETLQTQAKGDLETREQAIQGLVSPLIETLKRYETQIQEMEKTRQSAYGSLEEQLRSLATVNQQLQKETGTLANTLKGGPAVRGRWGEMTLRRVAELAGMSEHCDFTEQESFESATGRQRPDMIVHLPNGREIAVDAKAPLQAFLDAAAAPTEDERRTKLARHAQLVRERMKELSAKAYWDQFDPAPEIVVLFLPGESFFSAALEQDHTLLEDGMQKHVVIATPTTLIALLRAVAFGWRQERIARNAQEISALGKDLYDRVRTFLSHFEGVGSSIKRATESYNRAVGSLESRVLPSVRKFKELGAATGDGMAELEPIDETTREMSSPEHSPSE